MTATHWDDVYRVRGVESTSWFQAEPATSMRLVTTWAPAEASVVDVGAGASTLVDRLLDEGRADCTVLDLSAEALEVVRRRLGDRASPVTFVVADLLDWAPSRSYDAWHDRAVFHFLVDDADRVRYVDLAARAVAPGGVAILATFGPDGPTHCSGLPTARYDAASLAAAFAPHFALVHAEVETHTTPGGGVQPFTWVVLRRTASSG